MSVIETICRKITDRDALDQLQEECAELIQAASKCIRIIKGEKTVNPRNARENLVEELSDMFVAATVVTYKLLDEEEQEKVNDLVAFKTQRWRERLSKAEQEGET